MNIINIMTRNPLAHPTRNLSISHPAQSSPRKGLISFSSFDARPLCCTASIVSGHEHNQDHSLHHTHH